MLLLLIFFVLHFFIGQLIEIKRVKVLAYFFGALLLAATLYFTLGVKDTADNFMYKYFFKISWDKMEPMFLILTDLVKHFDGKYYDFYQLHLVLYTFGFLFFISRYSRNYFYIFFAFIVLYYVPYVNQIRYYLAFPFFLISFYYLFREKRNIWLFSFFTVLAVLSHIAILPLYGFIPMYYLLSTRKFFKWVMWISLFVLMVVSVLLAMGIMQQIAHFGEYFKEGMTGSFIGGLYNSLPYILYLSYLWYLSLSYHKTHPDFEKDKMYSFLSKLSFFTICFIPASFFAQVLGHRYVFPFLIVWIIYFLYMIRDFQPQKKLTYFFSFMLIHMMSGLLIYIIPNYIFGESHFEEELIYSMKSVPYLKEFFR